MFAAPSLFAQYTINAGSAEGAPGQSISVSLTVTNDLPLRGFSLGLAHDDLIVALDDIVQGATLAAMNGGDGADYFLAETNPDNGPGGFIGCVISLSAPIEELAIGIDQELAVFEYTIAAAAVPGSSTSLDFSDTLGDPPVVTVMSNGTSYVPVQVSGAIDVVTPPVLDLACTIADACTCDFTLSWTNPIAYDSISVREDGIEIASLAGTAASYAGTLPSAGSALYAIVPTSGGVPGAASECSLSCIVLPPPQAPALTCSEGTSSALGCSFTFSWSGGDPYESAVLVLDGSTILATLGAADDPEVTAVIPEGSHEVCLTTTDSCAQSSEAACCSIECVISSDLPEFLRGDVNGTGGTNALVDALALLNWQFNSGPTPPCFDAADVDDNGLVIALVDALFLLNWQFSMGDEPPAPGPFVCGPDPTDPDTAGCETQPAACP
ncbi:MAG: hypothetical protein L0Z55_06185 [Planctomycetes bacterium]|nr:hypothetical protein [Planctomycetota bacterium]